MSTSSYQISGYTQGNWEEERANTRHIRRKDRNKNGQAQQEAVMNVMNANRHQLPEDVRGTMEDVIRIGATCIAEIQGRFFLLVEIEIEVPGPDIEEVVIFRITAAQAEALLRAGIDRCTIVNEIPKCRRGVEADLICVFVVGDFAFLVFDVENNEDELVLVRVPLCPII